jgi:hypothetical protein
MDFKLGNIQFEGEINLNPSFALFNKVIDLLERNLKIKCDDVPNMDDIVDVELGYNFDLSKENMPDSFIKDLSFKIRLSDSSIITALGNTKELVSQMDFNAGLLCLCTFSLLSINNRNAILNSPPKPNQFFEVAENAKILRRLNIDDVVFFEAEGSLTKIQLNTGEEILCSVNLKRFEEYACSFDCFKRVGRSHIVNFDYYESRTKEKRTTINLKSTMVVYDDKKGKGTVKEIVGVDIYIEPAYKSDILNYLKSRMFNLTQGK